MSLALANSEPMVAARSYEPSPQQLARSEARIDAKQCMNALKDGNIEEAMKQFKEGCEALASGGKGAEKAAPGQGDDSLKKLMEFLSQLFNGGKKAGESTPSSAAGESSPAKGGQQPGVEQMIEMLLQMMMQGGAQPGKATQ